MKTLYLENLDLSATAAIGMALGKNLFAGAFIALFGGLGAGKTTLTKSIAEGLGIEGVTSPTFTIVREHTDGRMPLYHFDAYRLSSADALYAMGFDEYLASGGVIVMEWCENVLAALPRHRLEISIAGMGDMPRAMEFLAMDKEHAQLIEALV